MKGRDGEGKGGEAGSSGGGGGGGDTSILQLVEECEQETSCRVVEGGEGRGKWRVQQRRSAGDVRRRCCVLVAVLGWGRNQ